MCGGDLDFLRLGILEGLPGGGGLLGTKLVVIEAQRVSVFGTRWGRGEVSQDLLKWLSVKGKDFSGKPPRGFQAGTR